ncbi:MAG: T9SS type A sorting domain-containing protein, partial [Bacteroidetes bacterium]|nr:T9SS type A sorting domain-containing protein [Bacteroidota bacterium]
SVLTDTTYYRLMQSSSHNYADKATNVVTIYVYPQFAVGSISDDQTVCFNTAPDLLIGTEPTGGHLPYTYQWQQSSDGVNFTDIAGANSLNYQAPAITVKTFFRQIQTSASNCGSFATDHVIMTIQAQPIVDIGVDQAMICSNQGYQLFAIAENYGSVTWTSLGDGSFSDVNILNPVYTPGQNDIASGSVTLVVNAIGISACEMLASDQMILSFYPTIVVNAGKDLTVYENSQIQIDATVTGSGNYSYLWSPAELVSDATILNPVTNPITDSTTLILRVTDIETGCSFYDQVTFRIEPGVTYQIKGVISTIGLKNTLPVTNVFFTGINKTTVTNNQGEYSMMVPSGYSGWAIPSRPGYVFEPDSIAFNYVAEDIIEQNYGGAFYMRAKATPDSIIAGQSVQLSVELVNSTNPITVCSWQDENGEFSTEKSPSVAPTQSTLYTVYIQDAYEKTFDTVRVYVSTTTGIDDQKTNEDKISLYPNPTRNIVHIEIGGVLDAQIISIVNPNGILVRQIKLPKSVYDQKVEINLENLIKGSYYLLITNSKGELIATKKVIKI